MSLVLKAIVQRITPRQHRVLSFTIVAFKRHGCAVRTSEITALMGKKERLHDVLAALHQMGLVEMQDRGTPRHFNQPIYWRPAADIDQTSAVERIDEFRRNASQRRSDRLAGAFANRRNLPPRATKAVDFGHGFADQNLKIRPGKPAPFRAVPEPQFERRGEADGAVVGMHRYGGRS